MLKTAIGRSARSTDVALPRDPAACFASVSRSPFPFLLDSAGGGRFSFAGSDPCAVLLARGDRLSLWREGREQTFRGNPFDAIAELLAEHRVENPDGLPLPCGAVG